MDGAVEIYVNWLIVQCLRHCDDRQPDQRRHRRLVSFKYIILEPGIYRCSL